MRLKGESNRSNEEKANPLEAKRLRKLLKQEGLMHNNFVSFHNAGKRVTRSKTNKEILDHVYHPEFKQNPERMEPNTVKMQAYDLGIGGIYEQALLEEQQAEPETPRERQKKRLKLL